MRINREKGNCPDSFRNDAELKSPGRRFIFGENEKKN